MSTGTEDESPGSTLGQKKSDETWKEKAQQEKQKLASSLDEEAERRLPPASIMGLVEELSMRAMLAMGQLRNAATGEVFFDLDEAKYAIDMLGVLEEKTRGNLQPSEQAGLTEILHGLRLAFVQVARNPPQVQPPLEPDAARQPDQGPGAQGPPERGPRIIL